jgi:hypothetical protein
MEEAEAEAVLGHTMTWAEAAWFRYSATMPDSWLLCHNVLVSAIVFLAVPLPLLLLEQSAPAVQATAPGAGPITYHPSRQHQGQFA